VSEWELMDVVRRSGAFIVVSVAAGDGGFDVLSSWCDGGVR
jgi:hypothetical protein